MNLAEIRANTNRTVTWTTPAGNPLPVVIVRVLTTDGIFGYPREPRVIVHIPGFRSEFDVDPEELSNDD